MDFLGGQEGVKGQGSKSCIARAFARCERGKSVHFARVYILRACYWACFGIIP